jgi:hypothetical protein
MLYVCRCHEKLCMIPTFNESFRNEFIEWMDIFTLWLPCVLVFGVGRLYRRTLSILEYMHGFMWQAVHVGEGVCLEVPGSPDTWQTCLAPFRFYIFGVNVM